MRAPQAGSTIARSAAHLRASGGRLSSRPPRRLRPSLRSIARSARELKIFLAVNKRDRAGLRRRVRAQAGGYPGPRACSETRLRQLQVARNARADEAAANHHNARLGGHLGRKLREWASAPADALSLLVVWPVPVRIVSERQERELKGAEEGNFRDRSILNSNIAASNSTRPRRTVFATLYRLWRLRRGHVAVPLGPKLGQ